VALIRHIDAMILTINCTISSKKSCVQSMIHHYHYLLISCNMALYPYPGKDSEGSANGTVPPLPPTMKPGLLTRGACNEYRKSNVQYVIEKRTKINLYCSINYTEDGIDKETILIGVISLALKGHHNCRRYKHLKFASTACKLS
jgi:hypothetical protein